MAELGVLSVRLNLVQNFETKRHGVMFYLGNPRGPLDSNLYQKSLTCPFGSQLSTHAARLRTGSSEK